MTTELITESSLYSQPLSPLPNFRSSPEQQSVYVLLLHCLSGAEYDLGGYVLMHPPTDVERKILRDRRGWLEVKLADFDVKRVAIAIGHAVKGYRNFFKPEENPKHVIAAYAQELIGIPTWACERACMTIRQGHAANISDKYPFSSMQLRKLAESYIAPWLTEIRMIDTVLNAKASRWAAT